MSRPTDDYPLLPSYRPSPQQLGRDSFESPTNAGVVAGSAGPGPSTSTSRTLSRVGSRGSSSSKGSPEVAGGEWVRGANATANMNVRGTIASAKARMSGSDDGPRPSKTVLFAANPDDMDTDERGHAYSTSAGTSATEPLLSGHVTASMELSEIERELALVDGPPEQMGSRGTLMESIANMANSIIGAGIVGDALQASGFVTGIGLLIGLAFVTDWTIRLVVVNAKLSGRDSYIDVMHHCFGRWGSTSVSFFQFAFAFGGMCAFNVIIGDTIPHVIAFILPSLETSHVLHWLVDRNVVIIIITLAISFPLSLHRDIVKLSKSSGFALISMGVIVTSVVLRGVAVDPELRGEASHVLSIVRPGVFEAIGVISFAFVCHHNTMYIYKSIDTPTLDRFYAVTHASTGMSLVACLLMAVTGYVVFTSKTQGNILNNFSPDDTIINIARFCFGANMSTTIPLENYVCREVIEDYFFKERPFSQKRHVIITSGIVFSSMAIALTTDDLGVVLEIAGGLSATALAFIFPAIAYVQLTGGAWNSRQKLPAVLCAVFGAVVLVSSCGLTLAKAFGLHA